MLKDARDIVIVRYGSAEETLAGAKRAVKKYRGARFHRHEGCRGEILQVVVGDMIVERHIYRPNQYGCW